MSLDEALWNEGYDAGYAALLAEMSALLAELEAVKDREKAARAIISEMLNEFSREMRYIPADQEQRWRAAAGLSEMKR